VIPDERWAEFDTPDGDHWRVDLGFLESGWQCIWGAGCRGIGPEADPTHIMGCCTLGAEFADEDDARNVAAHAAFLDPEHFQYASVAEAEGIFADDDRRATRVVDGGCIFLNRPGFAGGAGCALHQAALVDDEPPREWKPVVCWQLPFRIDVERADAGSDGAVTPVHVVRRWERADFDEPDDPSASIPWLCTEDDAAYVADSPALGRHRDDLVELLGDDAVVEIEARLS
jgi:hypothetical protein